MLKQILVVTAAVCSVIVAMLHVYIIIQGSWAYRFFGAGEEIATLAEQGSWIPALLTSGITAVFFVFATYYFVAAGLPLKLPLFKTGLIGVAALYTLRGAIILPAFLIGIKLSNFELWSSLLSLAIGLIHCGGAWLTLRTPKKGVKV